MMIVLIILLNSMSSLFVIMNTPITMVILIILTALNICMTITLCFLSSWYSYVLFLIFLGGLMVLFVYMCSVASNESPKNKLTNNMIGPIIFSLSMLMFMKMDYNKMMNLNLINTINSMFNSLNYSILILTMMYLLLTLFVTVLMSKMKFGPMRAKKN